MKRIISSFVVGLLCVTLSAQEKLNYFELVVDVIDNNLSLTQFQQKYNQYFTEREDDVSTIFSLKNIDFMGYEGTSLVTIEPEYKVKIVMGMPDYESLDSVSRYESAAVCHKKMIELLGEPSKAEVMTFDEPMQKEVAASINVTGGKSYTWMTGGAVVTGSLMNTEKEDMYMVTFFTMESPFATSSPVQRTYFKTLEFGKSVTKYQIASALGVDSYSVQEERQSSGKVYNYWRSIYFGGFEWSFVELKTVENLLSTIKFTHTSTKNNQELFDSLFKALGQKYGKPTIEDNEAFWYDGTTSIFLTYEYGESKGGEMRHYVNLEYTDMVLYNKAQDIITNEL